MKTESFDVAVIGAGQGGLPLAHMAARSASAARRNSDLSPAT
jgi:cation diffusion facilitator CzcD-associated flavoprotein CzcO